MAQPPRFAFRSEIFSRVSLSPGARMLYLYLDDHARETGKWFVQQKRIAVEVGACRRQVQEWLYELSSAACIVITEEPGKSSWYTMGWVAHTHAHQEDSGCAQACAGGAHTHAQPEQAYPYIQSSTSKSKNIIKPDDEETERVLGWLRDYPGALPAIGFLPPRAVARQCIEAAGGDLDTLAGLLTHLAKRQGAKPVQSWGWVPAVIRHHFAGQSRMEA